MTTYYKIKDKDAYAKANNCSISMKYSVELAREIKNKPYNKIVKYLENIIDLKTHLPLRRYNRDVAHRKGPALSGVKSGRYPVKTAKYFLKVLESAKANADYKGLESTKKDLIIKGAVVSQGVKRYSFQTQGRRRLRRKQTVNIEIVLTNQGKYVKKIDTKKTSEKPKEIKPEVNNVKAETNVVLKKEEKVITKVKAEKKEENKNKK